MEVQSKDYTTEIAYLINMFRSVKENLKMRKRKTEDIKKKQTASNNKYNTQSENTPKRLKNRLSTTEEKICESEYIIIETSQDEVQRENQ